MKIRIVAIVAGLAVDFIGSIMFVVAVILVASMVRRGVEPIWPGTSTVTGLLALYWIGLAFTLFGAYVTAVFSKPNCILNTFLFGLISTVPSFFFHGWHPTWITVLSVLTILPVSVAAGYAVAARAGLTKR